MTAKTDQHEIYFKIWAKAVDTQMHFNEMSVKSRQFGLAFVAAALGLGIALLTRNEDFSIAIPFLLGGFDINMTVIIAFVGAAALYAVMLLDLHVYHKMLRGAVTFNEDFERQYMKEIFALEKGMTEAISHFSRYDDAEAKPSTPDGKYVYKGKSRKNAYVKIRHFYIFTISTLCVLGVLLFLATAHFGNPRGAALKKSDEKNPSPATSIAPKTSSTGKQTTSPADKKEQPGGK